MTNDDLQPHVLVARAQFLECRPVRSPSELAWEVDFGQPLGPGGYDAVRVSDGRVLVRAAVSEGHSGQRRPDFVVVDGSRANAFLDLPLPNGGAAGNSGLLEDGRLFIVQNQEASHGPYQPTAAVWVGGPDANGTWDRYQVPTGYHISTVALPDQSRVIVGGAKLSADRTDRTRESRLNPAVLEINGSEAREMEPPFVYDFMRKRVSGICRLVQASDGVTMAAWEGLSTLEGHTHIAAQVGDSWMWTITGTVIAVRTELGGVFVACTNRGIYWLEPSWFGLAKSVEVAKVVLPEDRRLRPSTISRFCHRRLAGLLVDLESGAIADDEVFVFDESTSVFELGLSPDARPVGVAWL